MIRKVQVPPTGGGRSFLPILAAGGGSVQGATAVVAGVVPITRKAAIEPIIDLLGVKGAGCRGSARCNARVRRCSTDEKRGERAGAA